MIYLNIGSNLSSKKGNRFYNINKTIKLIKKLSVKIVKISSIYETPSYPNKSKPRFVNICIKIKSELDPYIFLKKVQKIEKYLGRTRKKVNEPRTCDIDIIDYNKKIIKNPKLIIPHPKLHLRNFVIYPLKEIEPEWSHPINNKKISDFFIKLNEKSHKEITRLNKNVILNI